MGANLVHKKAPQLRNNAMVRRFEKNISRYN
jgi:hypothetical protein